MKKKVIVLLAEGFEEVEAVTPVDYLCRAGADVTIASVGDSLIVKGARSGISITADVLLANVEMDGWDAVVIPGGMPGAANLAESKEAAHLIKKMAAAEKLICAICASPVVVLAPLGLLKGKRFTCYYGSDEIAGRIDCEGSLWTCDRVAEDGNLITSRAAGTAGEFSIAIIRALFGEEMSRKIAESILL